MHMHAEVWANAYVVNNCSEAGKDQCSKVHVLTLDRCSKHTLSFCLLCASILLPLLEQDSEQEILVLKVCGVVRLSNSVPQLDVEGFEQYAVMCLFLMSLLAMQACVARS